MKLEYRKTIFILLIVIVIFAIILLNKIKNTPDYNVELYEEIYKEYNEVLDLSELNTQDTNTSNDIKVDESTNSSKNEALKTTEDNVIAIIKIPKIDVFYPVISKTTTDNLKIAPSRLWGGEPNTVGNFCIIGHNLRNGEQFSNLDKIEKDDIIELSDRMGKTLKYTVYDKYLVEPDDLSCTSQETNNKKEVTLITCAENNKKRLIIKCVEV